MLQKLLVLVLVALATQGTRAQDCSASVTFLERPGTWTERGIAQRLFDIHLTNKGSCTLSGAVQANIALPAGASMGFAWGYNGLTGSMQVPETLPGQSYSGPGFVMHGWGNPSISSLTCKCSGSQLNNTDETPTQRPTNPPSSTSTPTNSPSSTTGSIPTTGATSTTGSTSTGATSTTGSNSTSAPTSAPTLQPTTAPTSAPTPSPLDTPYDVDLRVLLLTCTGVEPTLGVAQLIFDSVGASYDIVSQLNVGAGELSLNHTLDGSGKYYAIVSAGELACWNSAQTTQIAAYEEHFHVKTVILYSWPYPTNGVNCSIPGAQINGTLSLAPAMLPFATSLNRTMTVRIENSWVYPSKILDSSLATPALYFSPEGSNTQYTAAAFVTYNNNGVIRRRLEFYFNQATWGLFAAAIGPAWFNWVTNGLFAGSRRIEFNCHTDDVFMATGMFDPSIGDEGNETYRLSTDDLDRMVTWQQELVARLPAGSSFVTTFPFNGATIQEHKGYANDALYKKAVQVRDHFFWESHTWTHPYLTNLTYDKVYQEFLLNNDTALELFNNDLSNPNYNRLSVITPSITGLFNGDALKAMWDLGFRNLVNDNSHPEQAPAFPYHGWYTNETNGFSGMYVVPRHATNIYYDASLPINVEEFYNYMYSTNLTFDDIIVMEVETNTKNLLQLRHDPFMFHQANMRTFTYKGQETSLLTWWVDRIVDSVLSYFTLPMTSHTHDALADMFHAREARDACGFNARLRVDSETNTITGLHATSSSTCVFPISGVQATPSTGVTFETVGEEKTIWLTMQPNTPVELTFTSPVSLTGN